MKNKEMRGIYNVTFNDKTATPIKTDIELVEDAIIEQVAMYVRGYHNLEEDKGRGAEHIKLHLDENYEGHITLNELLNLGNSLRKYTKDFKEPFVDDSGAKIYEWENDKGVRFRAIIDNPHKSSVSPRHTSISQAHALTNQGTNATSIAESIISFYSDRNLNKQMKFKNPKVEEYYQQQKVLQNPASSNKKIFSKNPKPTQETREKLTQKVKEISNKSKIDKTCLNKSNDKDR